VLKKVKYAVKIIDLAFSRKLSQKYTLFSCRHFCENKNKFPRKYENQNICFNHILNFWRSVMFCCNVRRPMFTSLQHWSLVSNLGWLYLLNLMLAYNSLHCDCLNGHKNSGFIRFSLIDWGFERGQGRTFIAWTILLRYQCEFKNTFENGRWKNLPRESWAISSKSTHLTLL
jgi:hypothetical protein